MKETLNSTIRILLTDPKSRKVIIVEHPLLPLYIKDMMASVLFDNLQVRYMPFYLQILIERRDRSHPFRLCRVTY